MKNLLSILLLSFSCIITQAQLININPDTLSEPWWVFETSPITPEIQTVINNTPLLILTDTSINTPLPIVVDNSKYKYMPPVFMQRGGSCAQASGIGYTFTYEINRLRDLVSDSINQYPTHFTYNIVRNYDTNAYNVSSWYHDGWKLIKFAGCPTLPEYGGDIAPPEPMPWRERVWESDYDLYKSALDNRTKDWYRVDAKDSDGLIILKHWLSDHNEGDTVGGLACFTTYINEDTEWTLFDTIWIATELDTDDGYHAMTIVGYCDTIGIDFNEDGVICDTVDMNGDSIISMNEWELGAIKVVNSYNTAWPNTTFGSGYAYIPYRFLADTNSDGNASKVSNIMVVNAEDNNEERLLLKTTVAHEYRKKLIFKTGYANNANQTDPVEFTEIGIFNKQGGSWPMQSRFLNDTTPMECGLDFGQFYLNKDFGKIFLIIYENDYYNTNDGRLVNFSIIDYRWGEEFELISPIFDSSFNHLNNFYSINYDLIPHESSITTTDTLFSDMVSRFNPIVDNHATLLVEKGVAIDMYNSEITINEGSTLTLEDSVTITAKRDTCKIVIDGDINIGKHITFKAEEGALLEIWLNNELLETTFDSVYFENCKLFNKGSEFNISNSVFNSCEQVYSSSGKVSITNNSFSRTGIHILNPSESNFLTSVSNNSLTSNNSGILSGVQLFGCARFFVINNTISGFFNGIDLRFCGEGSSGNQTVMDNETSNCNFNGITSYYSTASLARNNIHDNYRGISLFNNCNTDVIGDISASTNEKTQQISNNKSYELYASGGSFPWLIRHNVIHDSDNEGNPTDPIVYYEPDPDQLIPDTNDIRLNCWDTSFSASADLYPPNEYYYTPTWCPGGKSLATQAAEPLSHRKLV